MPPELLMNVTLEVDANLRAYAILQVLHLEVVKSRGDGRGRFLSCP